MEAFTMRAFIHAKLYERSEDAFLVQDDRFAAFGSTDEILAQITPDTEVVDLNGAAVYPGFIDSHCHLLGFGRFLENVQLSSCRSNDELYARLKRRAETLAPGEWLIGRGFNEETFDVKELPDREGLDRVSRDIPIAVTRMCGHKMVVNSKALELAGIDENSRVEGGTIDTERGFLEENAIPLLQAAWPKETEESIRKAILQGQKEMNRYGITAVGSDDFISLTDDWRLVLNVLSKMAYRGELTVRINEQCEFPTVQEFAKFLDDGYTTDVGDDFFRIGPLKLLSDGSLGARTAALFEPYSDDPSKRGYMTMSRDDIRTWVKLAADYNMPSVIHAIGDLAVSTVLDVYEDIVLPGNPLHHGLVHCQIMSPEEINRVKAMHIDCYFQSLFIDDDAPILPKRVGAERAVSCYPFKSLSESVIAANGSDAPVETPDVLKGIQLAVTRKSVSEDAAMNPKECLSVKQAIDSYTVCGARIFSAEDRFGVLAEGYYADFAVLDTPIERAEIESIRNIPVMMTVMNGETVFER